MRQFDLHSSEKYCVFRSGHDRFCVPALALRNVGPLPALCHLPLTDEVLAGLAHEQREFFPVFSFSVARGADGESRSERQMLVLNSDVGPWGLLVDEVIGLESLELSLNAHRGQPGSWSAVSVGSTAHNDHFVTAIDAHNLAQHLQKRLDESWVQFHRDVTDQAEFCQIGAAEQSGAR